MSSANNQRAHLQLKKNHIAKIYVVHVRLVFVE